MKSFDLFSKYVELVLNKSINETSPVSLTGWQVVEALWPLNDVFRENFDSIKSLPYDAFFERETDQAIEDFIFNDSKFSDISAGAWRVLFERHQQAIMLALINEKEANPVMPVPSELPQSAFLNAAMLFLLHQMRLPFQITDRSDMTIPVGSAQASLMRH